MKKLIIIAGITAAAVFAASAAQARTMTDAEVFALISEEAYDDQPLDTVEFARMEMGAVKAITPSHSPYGISQAWNTEFNPTSGVSATRGEVSGASILDPLYTDID